MKLQNKTVLLLAMFIISCSNNIKKNYEYRNQNIKYLIKEGTKYWNQRSDQNSLVKSSHFLSSAHEIDSNNYDLSILYSKALNFRASFFEKNIEFRDSLYLRASKIARNAVFNILKNNDSNLINLDNQLEFIELINSPSLDISEGLYWWAMNKLLYLSNRPVIERINDREKLEAIMHLVISVRPDYFYGGPYRFFGLLYIKIPGIDLSQSKSYFDYAINKHPNYLGNKIFYSKYFHQKSGDKNRYLIELENVINADEKIIPELIPENTRFKEEAKILLKKANILFE